jgi:DNA repair protein RadD
LPVQPQDRRVQARKRLSQRTNSVVARILKDLGFVPAGREVGKAVKGVAGRDNRAAVTTLMHKAVNDHLGITSGKRKSPDVDDNEDALAALDVIGDQVRDAIRREIAS